jgi:hypothetical protein
MFRTVFRWPEQAEQAVKYWGETMAGRAEGLITAVQLAGGMGDLGLEADDQADMFEADAPLPIPAVGRSGPKGGRPKGARNASTEEWRAYLLGRYRSPLVFLLETFARTPEDLARQMKLYKFHEGKLVTDDAGRPVLATGDASSLQVQAAIAALPYLHQKQPIAVETTGVSAGMIVIGDIQGLARGEEGELRMTLVQPQQNQGFTDAEIVQSDDCKSDAAANPMKSNGE